MKNKRPVQGLLQNLKKAIILLLCFVLFGTAVLPADAASGRQKLSLTEKEQEFVAESDVITVALSPDNYPYSDLIDGVMVGVYPELLNLISHNTGLQFEILPCETYADYTALKKSRKADIVLATHVGAEDVKSAGYRRTSSYMEIPYSKIELIKNRSAGSMVATLEEPSAEATEAKKYYYSDQILYCNSMQECLDALNNRECEAVVMNNYAAEQIQYSDVKNQYVVKELYNNTILIYAGVNLECNAVLFQVMQKALGTIDDVTKEELINRNTQKLERESSVFEVIYTNPILLISALCLFFAIIFLIILLYSRVRKIALQQEKSEEYNRFVGYICTAVDAVTELNIRDRTMTRFVMRDGELLEEHETYPTNEWMMFHEEDRERFRKQFSNNNLRTICQEGRAVYSECRMLWNHSSEYHWCTCILQGIKPTRDKPFNLLLIIKDTHEIKTNEERQKKALEDAFEMAKQASLAKGTFLSKMSHEIRTPLNAIIGYLTIAKDSDDNIEKIMHCVDNGEIAAKHLLHIINDVLDISSIESGKMKIANDEFDLKKEISDITTIFFQNAKTKNVHFKVDVDGLTQEWVVGDSLRLNQVLMNLLSNAVKFTPENGLVRLAVKQLSQDEKTVYIQFVVSDTGIGMSKEYMSRLFQPFEQESASTAQKYGGTGLGLSITGNLVSMMGGTIDVKSEQGEGSTFTVTMHFEKSQEHSNEILGGKDYSHIRALVVDDQENEGTYVKTMLKRCGVKADSVTSGEKALKRIRSRQEGDYSYDLCILDWNMPEMDGIEVARKIREEFGKELPIIIATAYDITEFVDQAKETGVNKVISKPLFQSTLFDLLVSTFGKYEPQTIKPAKKMDMSLVHVLLAEDNEMNMEIAVTVLAKVGVKVDQAVNGQDAYEKFMASESGTYDMILMDVQMPVLNGYEATKKIRQSNHPEAKTIPIIAMTANAFAEDVAEALANGMNAHIAKPINYDKLFELVQKFSK